MEGNKKIGVYDVVLDSSPTSLAKEIFMSKDKVLRLLKDDSFIKNFEIKSLDKMRGEHAKHIIQAEICELLKIALSNFDDVKEIIKNPDAKKIIDYNKKIISETESLPEYQKRIIKTDSSYKYNLIMKETYDLFVDKILSLLTVFLNANYDDSDIFVKRALNLIDEITRSFSYEVYLGRIKEFRETNINHALKKAISKSERTVPMFYSEILNDILKREKISLDNTQCMKDEELSKIYLHEIDRLKMQENEDAKELTLTDVRENLITEDYFNSYIAFFINHAVADSFKNKYENLVAFTNVYTDFYGNMFRNNYCKIIDEEIESIKLCTDDETLFRYFNEKFLKSGFLKIEDNDIYLFVKESRKFKFSDIVHGYEQNSIFEILNAEKSYKFKNNDERNSFIYFLRMCIGGNYGLEFRCMVEDIEKKKEALAYKSKELRKNMKEELNKCIGYEWAKDM